MSRPESQALAGFFPTPIELLPTIAKLVTFPATTDRDEISLLDPCAGDGTAIYALAKEWSEPSRRIRIYAAEMEKSRASKLDSRWVTSIDRKSLHSDAFKVRFAQGTSEGITVAYLNPPYDPDREYRRLEERFLVRFTPAIREGGALFFVVPFYALGSSAETLATHYDSIACYRFPGDHFAAFKQVVLVAQRRASLLSPDPALVATIEGWSRDADQIPELPSEPTPHLALAASEPYDSGLSTWEAASFDATSLLAAFEPFRGTRGLLPEHLGARRFPCAMPPRPAHIAAGIAAGVFDGARITSTTPSLPALLVKGVFNREYRTVDEKKNKSGEVTGLVQVQQPSLVVTVLDLSTHRYHTLKSAADTSGATRVEDMTLGDLLEHYGPSLLSTLLEHCPVLHDPADTSITIPLLKRPLFQAQANCVRAAVKLLGGARASRRARRGKAAVVLGEIGSGKSSVALAAAATIGATRMLVLCPPHLLDGWRDQTEAVLANTRVVVLNSVSDVDALAADTSTTPVVAILSRETAKLGHSFAAVQGRCPECGAAVPEGDLAKTRANCQATTITAANRPAQLAEALALAIAPAYPKSPRVHELLRGRGIRAALAVWSKRPAPGAVRHEALPSIAWRTALAYVTDPSSEAGRKLASALALLLDAINDYDLTARIARRMYTAAALSTDGYGEPADVRHTVRVLLSLLPADVARVVADDIREATPPEPTSYSGATSTAWASFDATIATRLAGKPDDERVSYAYRLPTDRGFEVVLERLAALGAWRQSEECGEPLYQAIPEPRRIPLAWYIAKRYPELFDLLVLDEFHEYSTDGSAQERAAHRLTALGIPTLGMTGSIMNGYAESLFSNLWAISPEFRREFRRDQRQLFIDRYGYRRRLVEERDAKTKTVVAYGSHTDRVETRERDLGSAPGVLPLFVLRHLLPIACTLQKSDLALDLPPCREIVEFVEPSIELASRHNAIAAQLKARIKADAFGELAGKLWGQMAELPSHLDRAPADVGNGPADGAYEICYPESVGGQLVARAEPLPANELLPKEQWILDRIAAEIAEGRNVLVFAWHVGLLPRLARLISSRIGEPAPILDPSKVPTAKRQSWIDREVIARKRRVLLTNPVCVQTGLNNLVHFSTQVWAQNPACNPIVYRQAVGRVDRIGQKLETRIYFPVYSGTSQSALHELLLSKVAVSLSTDGLDNESALAAAGATSDTATLGGFAVGRQLYELLTARAAEFSGSGVERARVTAPVAAPVVVAPIEEKPAVAKRRRFEQLPLFGGGEAA